MDCVGYRLKEEQNFRVDPEMWLYLKAYRIPHRPAFDIPAPWWDVDIMRPNQTRLATITLWEGGEEELRLPPGMYWLRFNGTVKATPHELSIHACLLTEGSKQNYPLRRTRMACIESGSLRNATVRGTGKSLNLAGVTSAYLHFQPTEVVKGKGRAEVTLEHSPDNKTWEPVSHGGFPDSKFTIDQEHPSVVSDQMCLVGGIRQYVRWAYNPTDVIGWGIRGHFYYSYESRHRR